MTPPPIAWLVASKMKRCAALEPAESTFFEMFIASCEETQTSSGDRR